MGSLQRTAQPATNSMAMAGSQWRWYDVAIGLALLAFLLTVQAALLLSGSMPGPDSPVERQAFALFPTIATAYAVLWLARLRGLTLERFGFRRARILRPAFIAWCVACLAGPLYAALLAVAGIAPAALELLVTPGILLLGFGIVVVAPIVEEIVFRALLFRWLRQRWPIWPAAILSGLIFAAFHLDPMTLVPLTMVGAAFAWAFDRTGSLWAAIAPHSGLNALVLLSVVVR